MKTFKNIVNGTIIVVESAAALSLLHGALASIKLASIMGKAGAAIGDDMIRRVAESGAISEEKLAEAQEKMERIRNATV